MSDKGRICTDQVRPALGSVGCLVGCHHAQKTSKLPYFRLFQPVTQILSALTALTWPSYRLLLTQYHQIPTSTALYWPSTIMYHPLLIHYHQVLTSIAPFWPSTIVYQPVPPSTDPAPSYINLYCSILTHYHQVPNSSTLYWPRTTKYQQATAYTDPVPPSTKQYHPILLNMVSHSLTTYFQEDLEP